VVVQWRECFERDEIARPGAIQKKEVIWIKLLTDEPIVIGIRISNMIICATKEVASGTNEEGGHKTEPIL